MERGEGERSAAAERNQKFGTRRGFSPDPQSAGTRPLVEMPAVPAGEQEKTEATEDARN